jgi:hypothetical protein
MELDVMPDGKVIYIERRGNVKQYDPRNPAGKATGPF